MFIPSCFKNRWAPSRHSGLSSLSPNDPNNSEIWNHCYIYIGWHHSPQSMHHNVCLTRSLPQAHVAANDCHNVSPAFASNQISQCYDCVGIFVQSKHTDGNAATFCSLQCSTHDGPSASTNNHDNWQLTRLRQCTAAAAVTIAINQCSKGCILIKFVPETRKSLPAPFKHFISAFQDVQIKRKRNPATYFTGSCSKTS